MRMRLGAVLLVLACIGSKAAAEAPAPTRDRACTATLPGAHTEMHSGVCYEMLVANTGDDTAPLPLVIGLHWSGSTPREFREVLAGIRHPVRLVLLQGGQPRRNGFSFYPVDPYYYDMDAATQREVQRTTADRLAELVRALDRRFRGCARPVVVGASQGGDLSYLLGLRHADTVGLAIPLMATIDPTLVPERATRRVPIRPMHGVDDAVVPIATARSLVDATKGKGFDVRLAEFDGVGHDVPPGMRNALAKVIDGHLAGVGCAP